MIKRSVGVLLALTLLSWTAIAQSFDGETVSEVRVSGLDRVSEQAVRAQIEIQPEQAFNDRAVARDIRRLYGLGYFSKISADVNRGPNGLVLTYIFQEKQFVEEIKLIGNAKMNDRRVTGALTMREGDAFLPESLAGEREALLELYESKGYANSTVDITTEVVGPSRVRIVYDINEGRKARIKSIKFVGNESLAPKELRGAMNTKRAWWFLGGKYEEDKFENDLDLLMDLYGEHGRLESVVESVDMLYDDSGKRVDITIYLKEGPQYTVGDLELADNIVYGDEELVELTEVVEGDIHNKTQVAEDAARLQQIYQESGYVDARVDAQVTLDRENKTTNVVHDINEGDLKYVREIEITGNEVTKDEVIRRQIAQTPGQRYDGSALDWSRRSLENLDYFDKVRLTLRGVDDSDLYTDVLVDVEEGRTGNFLFGGGFSTDEGAGGYAEIRLRNFDITNWPSFSGGGQQLRLRANIGSQSDSYLLSFTDPEFLGYPFSFGFDVYDQVSEIPQQDYTEESRGVGIRLGKALTQRLYWSWAIRADQSKVSDLPFIYLLDRDIPDQRKRETIVRTITSLNYTTLDRRFDTTRGTQQGIAWEVAGLGGDYDFFKLNVDSKWYWPISKNEKWVLSFQTREGLIVPMGDTDEIPLQERMYAGGTSSVRGYDFRDIGPRTRDFLFFDDFSLGGELNWITNTEIKFRATDLLRVYGFVDTGGVWAEPGDFDFGDIKASAGIGLGFNVPAVGPIRIDYGFALNPDDRQPSGRLHLNGGFAF